MFKAESIHGDEYYTLREDAEAMVRCLKPISGKVWLPFGDNIHTAFADALIGGGYDVVVTDGDFFETETPEGVVAVVGNPPFSKKQMILEDITRRGLKFALVLLFLWLNDGVPLDYGNEFVFCRTRWKFSSPRDPEARMSPRTNCFFMSNGLLKDRLILIDNRKSRKVGKQ